VESSYFHHHITKLKNALRRPRSLPFTGESEPLTELLVVGRQNPSALDKLLEIAEYKRDSRNDYQRQYMAAKRTRDRKVIKLESLLRGKDISTDERRKVLLKQYAVWNKEKDEYLAKDPEADWAQRNAMIRLFWETKDAELDELIAEAQSVLDKKLPKPHKKRTVTVMPPKRTTLRDAFDRARQSKK